jgi:hypothetical protein
MPSLACPLSTRATTGTGAAAAKRELAAVTTSEDIYEITNCWCRTS